MKKFYCGMSFDDNSQDDDYFGDKRIRPYLSYEKHKEGTYTCIYCGETANSREHLPSRIFLDLPYPEDIAIAPACETCNKLISRDEQFVACLVEFLRSQIYGVPLERNKIQDTFIHSPAILEKIKSMFTIDGNLKSECYDEYTQRIKNIAAKLVIGHALYDLSEFFPHYMNKDYDSPKALIGQQLSLDGKHISIYSDFTIIESDVQFALVSQLTEEQRKEFNLPIASNLFPEIGSRSFVDTILHPGRSDISYEWTMLQSDNYRYLSAPGIVRIVIRETLYIEAHI